jgi:diaminohydroxyphosphoribosylaminopyrimidine deaminase/5-amino-6-(5-phosphoribosylamino)uracil reductase
VQRVVAACADPSPVAAGGADRLREAGLEVTLGVEEAAARSSTRRSSTRCRAIGRSCSSSSRSRSTARWPITRGSRAGSRASSRGARSTACGRGSDAIAVGIGTALADDPELTVRHAPPPRVAPTRIVFDTSARLPRTSKLAQTAAQLPVIVVCWAPEPAHAAALEHTGVTLLHAATSRDALVALARARGSYPARRGGRGASRRRSPGGARRSPDYLSGTPRARQRRAERVRVHAAVACR